MIKKRRKSDKKKQRCIISVEKMTKLDNKPIEKTMSVNQSILKKPKNGRAIDVKKELFIEENHPPVESELKQQPLERSNKEKSEKQSVEKPKLKVTEDITEKIKFNKSLSKTKQWYVNFNIYYKNFNSINTFFCKYLYM